LRIRKLRLAAGGWLLAAGGWMLDAGCWMLDTGCWMLDAGFWLVLLNDYYRNPVMSPLRKVKRK
jgi:hypothetical protein